jgi:hypothetical protein
MDLILASPRNAIAGNSYLLRAQILFRREMGDIETDIESFVRDYVTSLEKLVKEKRIEIESVGYVPSFPTEFPVRCSVFLGDVGIIVDFEKASHLEVTIRKNERPPAKTKWSEAIPYSLFEKIKKRAPEKALLDVNYHLNLPKMIEDHEQEMLRQYEAQDREYWIAEITYTIENYADFLSKAKEVIDKTIEEAKDELYEMIKVIRNHASNYEYMFRIGCKALARLHFMINSDLETSSFLALNGKYVAASAILRKILEVNLRCIYFSSVGPTQAEKVLEEWIEGGKFPYDFRKEVLNGLISGKDKDLTGLLKKLGIFNNASFKELVSSLYSDLCVFVHLRRKTPRHEDFRFSFSEFSKEKFLDYHALYMKVVKVTEILLVLKFPRVVSTPNIAGDGNYVGLALSEQHLSAIAEFSETYGSF